MQNIKNEAEDTGPIFLNIFMLAYQPKGYDLRSAEDYEMEYLDVLQSNAVRCSKEPNAVLNLYLKEGGIGRPHHRLFGFEK